MASGDLRWQEFEEDSSIDYVKSSHDFVALDHVWCCCLPTPMTLVCTEMLWMCVLYVGFGSR